MALRKLPLSEAQWRIRVKQWFPFEAAYSMDILLSYALSVEAQVKSSINEYKERRKDWENDFNELLHGEPHPEEPDFEHVGLKGHVKDLDGVFEEYFPSLQRSSALSSIYSVFENELNRLCDMVQSAVGSGLRLKDLNGSGVERARNFLIKVGGFDLSAGEQEWNVVTKIREVRNCFVHSDGTFRDNDKAKKVITAYAKETIFMVVRGNRVELLEGYLGEVVAGLVRFCEVIAQAATARFPASK